MTLQQTLDQASELGLSHIIVPAGTFEEEKELVAPNPKFFIYSIGKEVRDLVSVGKILTLNQPIYNTWFMTGVYISLI